MGKSSGFNNNNNNNNNNKNNNRFDSLPIIKKVIRTKPQTHAVCT